LDWKFKKHDLTEQGYGSENGFLGLINGKAMQNYKGMQKKMTPGGIRFEIFWKRDLLKTANTVLRLYGKKISDKQVYTLEKSIMESIVHFRQNRDYYFNVKRNYPKTIDLRSFPVKEVKTEDGGYQITYDLYKGESVKTKLDDLCNNVTHVTILNNYIIGVFFSTHNGTNRGLYCLDFIDFCKILFSLREDKEIGVEPKFDESGHLTEFKFTGKW
jgi:hypothetical protein